MPNLVPDTRDGKEHLIQPLRNSQYSVKSAATRRHTKSQVNVREGGCHLFCLGNRGRILEVMYRLGFKEEIDGKRKRGIPGKGTDLGKVSSVEGAADSLGRGVVKMNLRSDVWALDAMGFQ